MHAVSRLVSHRHPKTSTLSKTRKPPLRPPAATRHRPKPTARRAGACATPLRLRRERRGRLVVIRTARTPHRCRSLEPSRPPKRTVPWTSLLHCQPKSTALPPRTCRCVATLRPRQRVPACQRERTPESRTGRPRYRVSPTRGRCSWTLRAPRITARRSAPATVSTRAEARSENRSTEPEDSRAGSLPQRLGVALPHHTRRSEHRQGLCRASIPSPC